MQQPNNLQLLSLEIVYASFSSQMTISIQVPQGTTVKEAIDQSGILDHMKEIDLKIQAVGIFSRPVHLSDKVSHHDRIEIYRPLKIDPKEARKLRAYQSE